MAVTRTSRFGGRTIATAVRSATGDVRYLENLPMIVRVLVRVSTMGFQALCQPARRVLTGAHLSPTWIGARTTRCHGAPRDVVMVGVCASVDADGTTSTGRVSPIIGAESPGFTTSRRDRW